MVSASAITLAAAFASAFLVRADVVPSEPSPGAVYHEGQPCPISWGGDTSSTTLWKNMNIQLMSGDNFDMIPVTTVATNQDGTTAGHFQYPCPNVIPNAAIYFYQFSAPLASNKTWTGRFTIASPTGDTTPPANSTQPDGENIAWGVGALTDTSQVVPPPPSAGGSTSSSNSSVPTVPTSLPTSPSAVIPPTIPVGPPTTSGLVVVTTVVAASPSPTSGGQNTASQASGAIGMAAPYKSIRSFAGLVLSAVAFTLLL